MSWLRPQWRERGNQENSDANELVSRRRARERCSYLGFVVLELDVVQRLALLAIQIEGLNNRIPRPSTAFRAPAFFAETAAALIEVGAILTFICLRNNRCR